MEDGQNLMDVSDSAFWGQGKTGASNFGDFLGISELLGCLVRDPWNMGVGFKLVYGPSLFSWLCNM